MVPFTVMICKTRNLDPCKLTDSCDISSSSNSNRSLWSFNSLTSCLGKKKKSFNIYSAGTSHIMKYTRARELLSSIADMSNKIWLSVCIQEILVVKKLSVHLSPHLYEFPYPILKLKRNVHVCSRRSEARKLASNFSLLVPYILS